MSGKTGDWHGQKERTAGFWQMRFMLGSYRLLGARGMRFVVRPVVFCFWLFAPRVRAFSRAYLRRVASFRGECRSRPFDTLRHVLSFAYSMVEKIAAWSGDLDLDNIRFHEDAVAELIGLLESGKGAVVVCSHIGNMEILRALATCNKTKVSRPFMVNSVVDFSGTAQFNRLIQEINPESMMNLVDANAIGVDTMIDLQERIGRGELLVIAGDRTSANTPGKVETVSFLGERARFPQGAFILASLVDSPVYFMFGVRERDMDPGSTYDLHVIRSSVSFGESRKERKEKIGAVVAEYVGHLERFCAVHPLQWYNFYDFWNESQKKGRRKVHD